ncbi:hypothetical protein [Agreia pratensis]|uniref:Uncharacterized protein n=1 Tax=Agreia pratensis TaxID=150121 RepID=A0A1X7JLN6_9MICO|nr:hypothetical protein [Agreia pratensis]SMG29122.1 hypothetical protein SAMN06296010_1542 [Agreia pratensis]
MSDETGLYAQKEAFNEVGVLLYRLLGDGDTRIQYVATLLAPVTYEYVDAYNPAGKLESPDGKFRSVRVSTELSKALAELRAASYREGAGTWFSIKITVTAAGAATAEYNYDEEPEWDAPVDSVAYVADQEKFPRDVDKQPEWLKQKLAEGRAALAARGK